MSQRVGLDMRQELLAIVEQHWRELTLRDARLLCVELFEREAEPWPNIKETLSCA